LSHALQMTIVVTIAYCASFLAVTLIVPLQRALMPGHEELASLFFLPHGVRVLAFFFFGWMAMAFLLPGKVIMWAAMALLFGYGGLSVWGSVVSLLSCLLAYEMAKIIFRKSAKAGPRFSWQMVMTMGVIASLVNAIGLTLLQAQRPDVAMMATYVLGDMLGLTCVMLGLMYYFRWSDRPRA
jgi:signal transduction histidine kinase